jgi:hypothetical protein
MKIKITLLPVGLLLLINLLNGQETRQKRIFVETGMDFVECNADNRDYIRQSEQPEVYYNSDDLGGLLYKNYAGIKAEMKFMKNRLGISSGLRFTRMESSIGKETYWESGDDYYYMLYRHQDNSVYYLRVKDITQVTEYLGIPLEARFCPYRSRFFRLYYKVGFSVNFRLNNDVNIHFLDSSMEKYESDAGNLVEEPWRVYSTLQLAVGLRFGKDDKPNLSIEACLPECMLVSSDKQSFVSPVAGLGVQLNYSIPF